MTSKTNLNNVGPSNLSVPSPLSGVPNVSGPLAAQEVVSDFLRFHHRHHVESLHIPLEKDRHLGDIPFLHLPKFQLGFGFELVHTDHPCQGHVSGDEGESALDELRDIEGTMVVSADRYGGGDDDACGIDGLEDAFEVALASHLLDENRCEPFRA